MNIMKTENNKIVKVCVTGCLKKPFKATVGNKTHTFCCINGFEKSLKAFAESIKKNRKLKSIHN